MIFQKTKPFNSEKLQGDVLGRIPEVIYDVGAYNGDGIAKYRKLYPLAKIYGLEPIKALNEILKGRFRKDENIWLFDEALCDKRNKGEFYINKSPDTSSLLIPSTRSCDYIDAALLENVEVVTVPLETLDGFCPMRGTKHIDILKMDIQGGELLALHGAKSLLERKAISEIYLEFIIAPLYVGQASFMDICSFLSSYNYSLQGLYELTTDKDGSVKWGNALFLNGATI